MAALTWYVWQAARARAKHAQRMREEMGLYQGKVDAAEVLAALD